MPRLLKRSLGLSLDGIENVEGSGSCSRRDAVTWGGYALRPSQVSCSGTPTTGRSSLAVVSKRAGLSGLEGVHWEAEEAGLPPCRPIPDLTSWGTLSLAGVPPRIWCGSGPGLAPTPYRVPSPRGSGGGCWGWGDWASATGGGRRRRLRQAWHARQPTHKPRPPRTPMMMQVSRPEDGGGGEVGPRERQGRFEPQGWYRNRVRVYGSWGWGRTCQWHLSGAWN